jgi:ferredoxin
MTDTKCFVNEHCIGCGTCVAVAEKLFAMTWGRAEVIVQPETDADKSAFKVAQMSCPVWAIIEEAKVIEMWTPAIDEDIKLAA